MLKSMLRSLNKYCNEYKKYLWTLTKLKLNNDKKERKRLFSKSMGSSMVNVKASV